MIHIVALHGRIKAAVNDDHRQRRSMLQINAHIQ